MVIALVLDDIIHTRAEFTWPRNLRLRVRL